MFAICQTEALMSENVKMAARHFYPLFVSQTVFSVQITDRVSHPVNPVEGTRICDGFSEIVGSNRLAICVIIILLKINYVGIMENSSILSLCRTVRPR